MTKDLNERVADAWRSISGADAAAEPPEWVHACKNAVGFCERYLAADSNENRLFALYNGYGALLGFEKVREIVAAAKGEDLAQRLLESVTSLREESRDIGSSIGKVLLSREEMEELYQDLLARVLRK